MKAESALEIMAKNDNAIIMESHSQLPLPILDDPMPASNEIQPVADVSMIPLD
jgi:hypothetical protein